MDSREQTLKCQALTCACIDQDVMALTRLLLDPVYKALIDHRGFGGNAPIHIAILSRNLPLLSMLLDAGADRNKRNINGDMPMHCACRVGFLDGLRLLCSFRRIVTDGLNDAGQLPMELALSKETESLRESDLYGVFQVAEDRVDTSIIDLAGREQCAIFLRTVSSRQRIDRMNDYYDETVDLNRTKQKVTNILRDSNKGRSKIYYARYLKPPSGTIDCWNDRDYQIFENSSSLFNRMVISVGSICLVSSILATTILAYDEKKAVEHQLWLYSRRKEQETEGVGGVSKNREFFRTPVAASGRRDNLPEYDYTSYEIDDIMSDEEAGYFEATDDMVTSLLLLAMQNVSKASTGDSSRSTVHAVSESFVEEVLTAGIIQSSSIISEMLTKKSSFTEFSTNFVSSVVLSGLSQCLQAGHSGEAAAFADQILRHTLSTGLPHLLTDSDVSNAVGQVASRFVSGVLNVAQLGSVESQSLKAVSSCAREVVSDVLTAGLQVFQWNGNSPPTLALQGRSRGTAKHQYEEVEMAERYVTDLLHTLAETAAGPGDDIVKESAVSALAKAFVATVLGTAVPPTIPTTCLSDFSSVFVQHVVAAALKSSSSNGQTEITPTSKYSAAAESFVATVIRAGLRVFDDSLSAAEELEHMDSILGSFHCKEEGKTDPSPAAASKAFVKDIMSAGMKEVAAHMTQHATHVDNGAAHIRYSNGNENLSDGLTNSATVTLARDLISQCISEGMARISSREQPMLNTGQLQFSKFVEYFTTDVLRQGLRTAAAAENERSIVDVSNDDDNLNEGTAAVFVTTGVHSLEGGTRMKS